MFGRLPGLVGLSSSVLVYSSGLLGLSSSVLFTPPSLLGLSPGVLFTPPDLLGLPLLFLPPSSFFPLALDFRSSGLLGLSSSVLFTPPSLLGLSSSVLFTPPSLLGLSSSVLFTPPSLRLTLCVLGALNLLATRFLLPTVSFFRSALYLAPSLFLFFSSSGLLGLSPGVLLSALGLRGLPALLCLLLRLRSPAILLKAAFGLGLSPLFFGTLPFIFGSPPLLFGTPGIFCSLFSFITPTLLLFLPTLLLLSPTLLLSSSLRIGVNCSYK